MDVEQSDELGRRQQELQGDVSQLLAHAAGHPDVWGGLWFDGPRVVVGFTEQAAHESMVRSLVDHPDRLDVVTVPFSQAELTEVRDGVDAALHEAPGSWWSSGTSATGVTVELSGTGLALAQRLHGLYGSRVRLTVAGHDFPFPPAAYDRAPAPGPVATAAWPDGLDCRLELDDGPVSGGLLTGRLVLSAGEQPVFLRSGQPFHAVLLDDDGWLAGRHLTFHVGTGLTVDLAPGQRQAVSVEAGTDSADLRRGTVVPPGAWHLAVVIPVLRADDAEPGAPRQLVAGPFPVLLG